jgi:ribosomal-protein-alanine N-acetyltransferase
MNSPPKNFFTLRLLLRPPEIEDASAIFKEYACDPEVTKYLTWKAHATVKETEKFLKHCKHVWNEGTSFPWTILRKSDDQIMGMIEASFEQTGVLLGFVLGKRYWGKEYMPEAIKALISWCMAQKDIHRVWAFCDRENRASARTLVKSGMKKEGLLRKWIVLPRFGDIPRDCICYSKVKE